MSMLASIRKGTRLAAPKMIVYGPGKIGKSSFASQIKGALFIDIEGGLDALDVASVRVDSWQQVMAVLGELETTDHPHRAVVIDSLDWAERLLWQHVCDQHRVRSIEEVGGGFGKGYLEATKVWADLFSALDRLRNGKGMAIVLIAHDSVAKMLPPDGEPYTYNELKLHARAAALAREWADIIGYATERSIIRKDDAGFNKKHARAVSTNNRVLILGRNPAYVTGNRFSLPDEIPLEWAAFVGALKSTTTTTTEN